MISMRSTRVMSADSIACISSRASPCPRTHGCRARSRAGGWRRGGCRICRDRPTRVRRGSPTRTAPVPGTGRDSYPSNLAVAQCLSGEGPQRRLVAQHLVDGVREQRGFGPKQRPLVGVGGEQSERVGDPADRGVQRRREVVDHQRRALALRQLSGVGGDEDVVADAAVDHRAAAHHLRENRSIWRLAGTALAAYRLTGPSVSNVAAPQCRRFFRLSSGQPTRSGTTASGNAVARSVTPSTAVGDGRFDDRSARVCDGVTDGAQRPREHAVCDELASLVVVGAVAVERGAAGQPVRDGLSADPLAGDERLVVAQHGLALGVAGHARTPDGGPARPPGPARAAARSAGRGR